MIEPMKIWLVQQNPGHAEAVVAASTSEQAKSLAETDGAVRVDVHTLVTELGKAAPDRFPLSILILAGSSPYA